MCHNTGMLCETFASKYNYIIYILFSQSCQSTCHKTSMLSEYQEENDKGVGWGLGDGWGGGGELGSVVKLAITWSSSLVSATVTLLILHPMIFQNFSQHLKKLEQAANHAMHIPQQNYPIFPSGNHAAML